MTRADLAPARSLGELFDSLEPSLRRPVEIFGLLHLAADLAREDGVRTTAADEPAESYVAVRHDGSRRTFAVPRVALPDPDLDPQQQEARA